ncbi:hypothetical protein D3C86_1545910 [compost metagenome]
MENRSGACGCMCGKSSGKRRAPAMTARACCSPRPCLLSARRWCRARRLLAIRCQAAALAGVWGGWPPIWIHSSFACAWAASSTPSSCRSTATCCSACWPKTATPCCSRCRASLASRNWYSMASPLPYVWPTWHRRVGCPGKRSRRLSPAHWSTTLARSCCPPSCTGPGTWMPASARLSAPMSACCASGWRAASGWPHRSWMR